MAVLFSPLNPTAGVPQSVVASRRPRNMLQKGFYQPEQTAELPEQESQYVAQPEITKDLQAPEQRMNNFVSQPVTGDYLNEQLTRFRQKSNLPNLQPGARVKSANEELIDPIGFDSYYQQMNSILDYGEEATRRAQAKNQFSLAEQFQNILGQGVQGGTGNVQLQGGPYKPYTGKHAPLGMLGNVSPYARNAAYELSGKFGFTNIGGHATSGHIPGSDHYTGKAIDVMGAKYSTVQYALARARQWRVKYIIFNRQYWEPGKSPVRYTGANPHTGHVHISFY